MNKKLAFSILFFSFLFSVSIHAQLIQVNPKFGEVSKAEVELDTYPLDTTASLLLLYRCVYLSEPCHQKSLSNFQP